MSGPPRINDTVHNQLDMEWSNSLGEKKKPWKTMLSFVIILAVILLAILVPGFRLGSSPGSPHGKGSGPPRKSHTHPGAQAPCPPSGHEPSSAVRGTTLKVR